MGNKRSFRPQSINPHFNSLYLCVMKTQSINKKNRWLTIKELKELNNLKNGRGGYSKKALENLMKVGVLFYALYKKQKVQRMQGDGFCEME